MQVIVFPWGCHSGLGNVLLGHSQSTCTSWVKCEAIPCLATWEEFSPLDGMKDFITLPKLLAISPAHHAVAGFVLPEHFLHGICYLPHSAPETDKTILLSAGCNENRTQTLLALSNSLAVGQIYLHWFPFSAATLKIQLTPLPPTDRMCTGIFKKILYCSCEN